MFLFNLLIWFFWNFFIGFSFYLMNADSILLFIIKYSKTSLYHYLRILRFYLGSLDSGVLIFYFLIMKKIIIMKKRSDFLLLIKFDTLMVDRKRNVYNIIWFAFVSTRNRWWSRGNEFVDRVPDLFVNFYRVYFFIIFVR